MPGPCLRARCYDPTTAQFLTVDPALAKTLSPYAYVAGNPLNRTDPGGLSASLPGGFCLKNPFDQGDSGCQSGANDFRQWESPDKGANYKTTSYGFGPATFSVSITQDGSTYFGGGFGPSLAPVSYSQRNGNIMASLGKQACVSSGDVNNFVAGGAVDIGAYAVVGGTVTATSIDGQHLDYATEYGVGTPNMSASVDYMFGPY